MEHIEVNKAKKYLESLKQLRIKAFVYADEIEQLLALAESCTVNTDKDCVQTSGSADKMSNIISKVVDNENKLNVITLTYKHRLSVIRRICDMFEDKRLCEFINLRYIEQKGLYATAEVLDVSNSTIKRIQKTAIIEFAKAYTKACSTQHIVEIPIK